MIGNSKSGHPHIDCTSYLMFNCDSPIPDFRVVKENKKHYFSTTEVVIAIRCNSDDDKPALLNKIGNLMH